MNESMEQAQRLTQVRGVAAVGIYLFLSFLFLSVLAWVGLLFRFFICQRG